MISEKYAKYYKSKPVGDFTKLYPQLTAPSFHIWGREWNSGTAWTVLRDRAFPDDQ
jgi:hypothetical protein